jgi:hypothetical protein
MKQVAAAVTISCRLSGLASGRITSLSGLAAG